MKDYTYFAEKAQKQLEEDKKLAATGVYTDNYKKCKAFLETQKAGYKHPYAYDSVVGA